MTDSPLLDPQIDVAAALQALEGLAVAVDFESGDPRSVKAAFRAVGAAIDAAMTAYGAIPWWNRPLPISRLKFGRPCTRSLIAPTHPCPIPSPARRRRRCTERCREPHRVSRLSSALLSWHSWRLRVSGPAAASRSSSPRRSAIRTHAPCRCARGSLFACSAGTGASLIIGAEPLKIAA